MKDQQLVISSAASQSNESRYNSEVLRVAVDLADIDLCKSILEDGADLGLGFNSFQGCQPLIYALDRTIDFHGASLEIAEMLALQGASIEGHTCDLGIMTGYTVFHYAASFGYVRLLQILLDKYPKRIFEAEEPVHPIHLAAIAGRYRCIELLTEHFIKHGERCRRCGRRSFADSSRRYKRASPK